MSDKEDETKMEIDESKIDESKKGLSRSNSGVSFLDEYPESPTPAPNRVDPRFSTTSALSQQSAEVSEITVPTDTGTQPSQPEKKRRFNYNNPTVQEARETALTMAKGLDATATTDIIKTMIEFKMRTGELSAVDAYASSSTETSPDRQDIKATAEQGTTASSSSSSSSVNPLTFGNEKSKDSMETDLKEHGIGDMSNETSYSLIKAEHPEVYDWIPTSLTFYKDKDKKDNKIEDDLMEYANEDIRNDIKETWFNNEVQNDTKIGRELTFESEVPDFVEEIAMNDQLEIGILNSLVDSNLDEYYNKGNDVANAFQDQSEELSNSFLDILCKEIDYITEKIVDDDDNFKVEGYEEYVGVEDDEELKQTIEDFYKDENEDNNGTEDRHDQEILDSVKEEIVFTYNFKQDKQEQSTEVRRSNRIKISTDKDTKEDEYNQVKNLDDTAKIAIKNAKKKTKEKAKEIYTKLDNKRKTSGTRATSKSVYSGAAASFVALNEKNIKNQNVKQTIRQHYKTRYSTASTNVSRFISNNFNIEDLNKSGRNELLKSIFHMLMGEKKTFSNFRENTAKNKPNDDQMGDVWGKTFTQVWARGKDPENPSYCYLSGAYFLEKEGAYPEMEHKICCTQFYTKIYNIELYKDLADYWKNFVEQVVPFEDMKAMYLALNRDGNIKKTTGKKMVSFEDYFEHIFNYFKESDNVQEYMSPENGDVDYRLNEVDDFKRLVKIYLSETAMSLHTPNQIKSDYYYADDNDLKVWDQMTIYKDHDMDQYRDADEWKAFKEDNLTGAVLSTEKTFKEKKLIKTALNKPENSDRRAKIKKQIEYINELITDYAEQNGITTKRLLIRSIKKIMLEEPIGKRAAILKMKELKQRAKDVNDRFIKEVTEFAFWSEDNKRIENTLSHYLHHVFPESRRSLKPNDIERRNYIMKSNDPTFFTKLEKIINLLYYSFHHVSAVEGLRIANFLFKAIHQQYINGFLDDCRSAPLYGDTGVIIRSNYRCARLKYTLNLLFAIRNGLFDNMKYKYKYDKFNDSEYDILNTHYSYVSGELKDKKEYIIYTDESIKNTTSPLVISESEEIQYQTNITLKNLFQQLYNYYASKVFPAGIDESSKSFIDDSIKTGPNNLLFMIAFNENFQKKAHGRESTNSKSKSSSSSSSRTILPNIFGKGGKKMRGSRKNINKTKKKRKDKRKTKKRKTYKRKNRRTKYKR